MSIAQAPDILLVMHGKFSIWHYLYPRNEQEGQEKSVFITWLMSLISLEADRCCCWRLGMATHQVERNVVTVLLQRWCKLWNAPDSPILDLDGSFKDDSDLT
ncbi:unnamed protein product [Ostreobium quekettii]|uniref:Uncharacterized protein n=1 Tax=Ostreobium quekettii TaxID=121088 RepID=A0A8S1J4U0_9CHLO|nr:unnamed protein product [Ostreobium quekettii]